MATPDSDKSTQSDRDLLASFVKKENTDAFETIVRRHQDMVLGVCRRTLGHSHDVEDAFQATFAVLAKNARRIRNPASLASWLHGVAHRICLRQLKRRLLLNEGAPIEPMIDDESPLEKLAQRSDEETVDDELRRMPDKHRCALVLHYLEDRTHQEIARELGITESAVAGRIRRGRAELRRRLLRRGIALSGFVSIVTRSQLSAASSAVETMVRNAVESSLSFAKGDTPVSLPSHQLAQLESTAMMLPTARIVSFSAAALVILGFGGFGISSFVAGQNLQTTSETVTVHSSRQDSSDTIVSFRGSDTLKPESKTNDRSPVTNDSTTVGRYRRAFERIKAQLDDTVELFEYSGARIDQFADDVSFRFDIPVLIDTRALEDFGIGTDALIRISVQGVSLRSALRLCLNEVDLTYAIVNEVILITTPEEAEAMLDTRVYDIGGTGIPGDKLIDLITETVLDDSWSKVGGPGKIVEATPTMLVVAQTQVGHERIADLLHQLTRAARPK